MENKSNNTESAFAGNGQQVDTNTIIEAVHKAVTAYSKYGTRRIPDDVIQDISQDVFVKVYSSIGSYDPSKASIQTWISTIANNRVCDYWKERAKREGWAKSNRNDYDSCPAELEDCFTGAEYNYKDTTPCEIYSDSDPEEDLISKEQLDWLYDHIDRLTDKTKSIIERHLDGIKPAQIAEDLGITSNAVSIIIYRTIQAMKKFGDLPDQAA